MSSRRRLRREQQRRECGRKLRHKSEQAAWLSLRCFKSRSHFDGLEMRAYRCRWCGFWHVGHVKGQARVRELAAFMDPALGEGGAG